MSASRVASGDHNSDLPRSVSMTLPRDPGGLLHAREAVEVVALAASPELREDTQLVVSELVTNALLHGDGRIRLHLTLGPDRRVRGQVVDGGDGFEPPSERPPGVEPHGWGLWIVDDLTERWGLARGSTRVWFEMPAPAPASARA